MPIKHSSRLGLTPVAGLVLASALAMPAVAGESAQVGSTGAGVQSPSVAEARGASGQPGVAPSSKASPSNDPAPLPDTGGRRGAGAYIDPDG
jgi:hypothetical protein